MLLPKNHNLGTQMLLASIFLLLLTAFALVYEIYLSNDFTGISSLSGEDAFKCAVLYGLIACIQISILIGALYALVIDLQRMFAVLAACLAVIGLMFSSLWGWYRILFDINIFV